MKRLLIIILLMPCLKVMAQYNIAQGIKTTSVTLTNVPSGVAGNDSVIVKSGSTNVVRKISATYYAPTASPALTGTPTAPTATQGTSTTQIASTAFVQTAVSGAVPQIVEVAGTSQTLAGATTYIFHNASTAITASLPATNPAIGTLITIIVDGIGRVKITQGASQFIVSGGTSSTVGVTGYVQTNTDNATISLRYVNTNKWLVSASNATPTIF